MKKIICCILIMLLVFSFGGCTGEKTEDGKNIYKIDESISMIEVVETHDFIIYVHEQTKVMYLYENRYNRGGLTVMLDENGKPLLYHPTEKGGVQE